MTNSTDALRVLVKESRAELAAAQGDLEAKQALAAQAAERVAVLRGEHETFLSALRRRAPQEFDTTSVEKPDAQGEWGDLARVTAVERALAELGSAGPADIQRFLADRGREEERDHVSAALAHLKRSGRAWRGGRSQWSTRPFPADVSGPDESGPENGVTTTGNGGDVHAQGDQGDRVDEDGWHRGDQPGDPAVAASLL